MFGLINRGNLPSTIQTEFENMAARLREIFLKEHNEDGTHITTIANLNFVPIGAILNWSTATAPTGWILCEGQQVSRLTYKGLFDVIGTTFGAGDGSTTFNVPDFRGRFALSKAAAGTGSVLASTGGALDHTHSGGTTSSDGAATTSSDGAATTSSDGGHTHSGTTGDESAFSVVDNTGGGSTISVAKGGGGVSGNHQHGFSTSSDGSHTHTIGNHTHTIGNHTHTGGTTSSNNPAYLVVNSIIFTGVS